MSRVLVVVSLLIVGCVPRSITERITALEVRVARLEAEAREPEAPPADPTGAADEGAATRLFRRAQDALVAGDVPAARALLGELLEKHPNTRAARSARRMHDELGLVGQRITDLSGAEMWFQGEEPDLSVGRHLIVFFETWCPHCRREVPRIPEIVGGRDVDVLLVTKVSRTATDDTVRAFLAEHDLPYATVKDGGAISERFAVRGIPAAAIVEDGVVVWRGHPGRLDGPLLDALLPED